MTNPLYSKYTDTVISDGPLAFWQSYDGIDHTGNSRHLTPFGKISSVVSPISGKVVPAFNYSAVSGPASDVPHYEVADAPWMDVTSITVEAIINYTKSSQPSMIVARDSAGARSWQLSVDPGTGKLLLIYATTGKPSLTTLPYFYAPTALTNGVHHVGFTHDEHTGLTKLFIDGSVVATETKPGALITGNASITVGAGAGGSNGSTMYFPCASSVEAIAIYPEALSDARIAAHGVNAAVAQPALHYTTSVLNDHFAPGETSIVIRPTGHTTGTGVMYVHGYGDNYTYPIRPTGMIQSLTNLVARYGHIGLSSDFGGVSTWGNDTAHARISTARQHLIDNLDVSNDKVVLVAGSMGVLNALSWAGNNSDKVQCVVGYLPVLDPNDVYVNNRGGLGPALSAAYQGGWSQSTHGSEHSPLTMAQAGAYSDIPILLFVGNTDAIATPTAAAAFAAATSSTTVVSLTGGHDYETYARASARIAAEFIQTHS